MLLSKVCQGSYWSISAHIVGNKAKGQISKRVFQENKASQIFQKTNISYFLIRTRTCAYQGVRNICFSENLVCFVFLKHPLLESPFCVITDDINLEPYHEEAGGKDQDTYFIRTYMLTYLFSVHSFSTPWKHQKTVRLPDVFRE